MSTRILLHAAFVLLGAFLGAVSQAMLKRAAGREYKNALSEYLNPLVTGAYVIFVGTTLLTVLAYRAIPLSMGPVLESTGYLWVTLFGTTIFGERMTKKKWAALALILAGIAIYAMGL